MPWNELTMMDDIDRTPFASAYIEVYAVQHLSQYVPASLTDLICPDASAGLMSWLHG